MKERISIHINIIPTFNLHIHSIDINIKNDLITRPKTEREVWTTDVGTVIYGPSMLYSTDLDNVHFEFASIGQNIVC